MSTNNNIKVTELDYNAIRDNLKSFLQGQEKFTDYDFDGSALSVLIDVLAYNTHYNALYTNMAINEMFLDSASKRNSIVSIANNFGYLPQSSKASRAILNVTVIPSNPSTSPEVLVLPAYSPFTSTVDGIPYTFYTLNDYSTFKEGSEYVFTDVIVYQGEPQNFYFACTEANQKFVLPNVDIDIETLAVTIQPTAEKPEYSKYSLSQEVVDLDSTSEVFFLKELEDRYLQLSFGINGLGKEINPGNVVNVKYIVTKKDAANGASIFVYNGVGLGGTVTAIATVKSYGGKQEETKDEIKINVTQSYFDQNRAVTAYDYATVIKRYYSNLDSINVWGGEDADPPQYGKVYVAVKPIGSPYLAPGEKTYITENILKNRGIVSIIPEIVDPTYLELEVNITAYYDRNKTTRTSDQLKTAIRNVVIDYDSNFLQKFDGAFRHSKFSAAIDNTDQSIKSSITTFTVYSEVIPKYNTKAQYKLNLVNPIYTEKVPEEAFLTTGFYIDSSDTVYYMDDDGVGNIRLYSYISGTTEKVFKDLSIGTINYSTGLITVNNLYITNLLEPNFYFMIKTQSYDVISVRNQIVTIPESRITINMIDDASSSLGYGNSVNYKFTSSRV